MKKILMLLGLLIIGLFLVSCAPVEEEQDFPSEEDDANLAGQAIKNYKCIDSDNGKNYEVFGYTNVTTIRGIIISVDVCKNSKRLREYYCSGFVETTCKNGCKNGACVVVIPICTSFTYSDWIACNISGWQSRTILTRTPTNCQGGNPVLTQSCTAVACVEADWTFALSPVTCPATGQQTKTWTKSGTCTGGISHPATETVACTYAPPAPTCTGTAPSNAQLCAGDDTGLTAATPKTIVAACTDAVKCEYTPCASGYILEDGACVVIPTNTTG